MRPEQYEKKMKRLKRWKKNEEKRRLEKFLKWRRAMRERRLREFDGEEAESCCSN